jgi:hypothetical protein
MDIMRFITVVSALLLASLSAFAADVAGNWAITIDSPQGPLAATLALKQDGDKLTGTITSQLGETPITGTVKDNDLEFSMTMEINGNSMALAYKAKVDGDKISGTLDFAGQAVIPFSGKKT